MSVAKPTLDVKSVDVGEFESGLAAGPVISRDRFILVANDRSDLQEF